MKNQHASILRKMGSVLLSALLIAVISVCCTLAVSAADGRATPEGMLSKITFAADSGIVYHSDVAVYTKVYDGASQIDPAHIRLEVVGETEQKKPTNVEAYFVSPTKTERQSDVGEAKLCVSYQWEGTQKKEYFSARITPKRLSFGDFVLSIPMCYDPAPTKTSYQYTLSEAELAQVSDRALGGVISADAGKVTVLSVGTVNISVDEFNGALNTGASLQKHLKVTLGGEKMMNYTLGDLDVTVLPTPIQITEVIWRLAGTEVTEALIFSYGDENSRAITAVGKLENGSFLDLIVKIKGTDLTLALADSKAWGEVREEAYVLEAVSSDPVHYALSGTQELEVSFEKAICEIEIEDTVFAGDAEHTPTLYLPSVVGVSDAVPADVTARIKYSYTLDGKTFVDAPNAPGKYTVQISLDEADTANYILKVTEVGKDADGVITVNVLPYRLNVGFEAGQADVLVFAEKGTLEGVSAALTSIEPARALLKGFTVYKAFRLELTGVKKGDSFRVVIPVHSDLLSDPKTAALTDKDLYVLDGETKCAAKDRYKVTLAENGAYYLVEGIATADGEELSLSLMIAPVYNVSFWATIPGVALIVFLVLLAVFALALIGLLLRRMEKRETNPVLVIDTEGNVPKVEPATAPDKLGSADECIDEALDAKEAALYDAVSPERAEEPNVSEEAAEMVNEMITDTVTEAAMLSLADDQDAKAIEEIDRMTEAMAEERAAELMETVDAEGDTIPSDDADLTAAMGEVLNAAIGADAEGGEEAPAEDAKEEIAAVGETVNAIVADALASLVEIPDGLLEKDAEESLGNGEGLDLAQKVQGAVEEAVRLITSDGAELKLREGVAQADLAALVAESTKKHAPAEWNEENVQNVTAAVITALEKALFN